MVVEVPVFQPIETLPAYKTAPETFAVDWIELAFALYAIGLFFFLMKFIFNLIQLVKNIRKHTFKKLNNLLIADDESIQSPYSFFNFVFLNTTDFGEKETAYIFKHEQAHAEGFHSIDLLFANLYTVFFWFNPFAWLYNKAIEQNLEFIAEESSIASKIDKNQYQLTLLKSFSIDAKIPLTHPFYKSFLKNRIVMMNQRKSPKHNALKSSVILPLLVLFFLQFQVEVVAQDKSKTIKETSSEAPIPPPPPTPNVETPTPPPPPPPFVEKPLVLIDGVEQTLEEIKPEDIKTINVLKDEHATGKYGEKGKNGVIEITLIHPDDAYLSSKNLKSDIQSNNLPENALYVIDDKITTRDAVEKLNPENIRAVYVI
ncbi:MAG: hypothetical protein CVT98_09915, partial [Bacteroidetes bacterium HGW-Bacteroidetes-15]